LFWCDISPITTLIERVGNEADVHNAKVIWARDMGPEQNQELLQYYSDCQVWVALPDETSPKVSPYTTPILELHRADGA
jgi:hypothetical protein